MTPFSEDWDIFPSLISDVLDSKALQGEIEKVRPLKLRYRNTPEEAFADYKKHKEAYIIMMVDKYIDYLPVNVYNALIDYIMR